MKKLLLILLLSFPINVFAVEVKQETEGVIREVKGAYLKKIEIKDFEISPTFNQMNNKYTLTIPSEIDSLEIIAEPYYENSRIQIVGNNHLDYGENLITITVTLEEDIQEYTIIVNREKVQSTFNYVNEEEEETIDSIYKDNYLIAIIASIVGFIILVIAVLMFKKKKR